MAVLASSAWASGASVGLPPASQTKLTVTAPFTGSSLQSNSLPTRSNPCDNWSNPDNGTFNLTSGAISFLGNTSSAFCASTTVSHHSGGQGVAFLDSLFVYVDVPFFTHFPTIYANFTYAYTSNVSLSLGKCKAAGSSRTGTCAGTAEAYFSMPGTADLHNRNVRSWYAPTLTSGLPTLTGYDDETISCNHSSGCTNSTYGRAGVAQSKGSFSLEYRPTKRMVKGDAYYFEFELQLYVYTALTETDAKLGYSTAAAAGDLATGTNGLVLTSLVET